MKKLIPLIFICVGIGLTVVIILCFLGIIGGVRITHGCLLRYNGNENGNISDSGAQESITLKANGNYEAEYKNGKFIPGGQYGQWVNTEYFIKKNQKVKLKIDGSVSLCKTHLMDNNLQRSSGLNINNDPIPIPNVEEGGVDGQNITIYGMGLPLIFSATTSEWRNVAELSFNDQIEVRVMSTQKSEPNIKSIQIIDIFNTKDFDNPAFTPVPGADCSSGQITYNPVCNRFTPYSGEFELKCGGLEPYCDTNLLDHANLFNGDKLILVKYDDCEGDEIKEYYYKNRDEAIERCKKYNGYLCNGAQGSKNGFKVSTIPGYKYSSIPVPPYDDSGKYTFDQNIDPLAIKDDCDSPDSQAKKPKFWFDSTNATGLKWRIVSKSGEILQKEKFVNAVDWAKGGIIFERTADDLVKLGEVGYLQFSFVRPGKSGGYALTLKQTTCYRVNGEAFDERDYVDRGRVRYIILPLKEDPNKSSNSLANSSPISFSNQEYTIDSSNVEGNLWLFIENKAEDYKESSGQYNITLFTTIENGSFGSILQKILNEFTSRIESSASKMFINMTCFGQIDKSRCFNFFLYVKSILVLYVVMYVLMMLLGIVEITQEQFIIHIIKIVIVAGLIDGKTYTFFAGYIIPLITNFTKGIIANIAGYNLPNIGNNSNPLLFLDVIMSRIFLNITFIAQVLALFSYGVSGILYFLLTVIAVVIFIIAIFRAICIYIMSLIAIALLIGIAPIFLTFMLFESTFYLFDNWVRFIFRYIMEPIIAFAGIIILSQLFTIYLDYALGYSVCWKCGIALKIPLSIIIPIGLKDIPILCINWFAPWGVNAATLPYINFMGTMTHFIALMIIAYTAYGYLELTEQIAFRLTNTNAPSTSSVSQNITQSISKKVGLDSQSLKKVYQQAKQLISSQREVKGSSGESGNESSAASKNSSSATKNIK